MRIITSIMILIISLYDVKAFNNLQSTKWIKAKELSGTVGITSSGHTISFNKDSQLLHLIKKNPYENNILIMEKDKNDARSVVMGQGDYWAKKLDPEARILVIETLK